MTLVMTFITAAGIFIAADGAASNYLTGSAEGTFKKLFQTGRTSGAAMNGNARWQGGVKADFYIVFSNVCAQLLKGPRVSIRSQSEQILQALINEVSTKNVSSMRASLKDDHLLTLVVGGYEASAPQAFVASIFLRRINGVVVVRPEFKQIHPGSCYWFSGHSEVAIALVKNDARLPKAVRDKREVAMVRAIAKPNCTALRQADAERFYETAVTATRAHGELFDISRDAVGPPLSGLLMSPFGTREVKLGLGSTK